MTCNLPTCASRGLGALVTGFELPGLGPACERVGRGARRAPAQHGLLQPPTWGRQPVWAVADAPAGTVSPGSPAAAAPGGFSPKAAPPPKASGSWQTSRPPAQGTPWPPQAKPPPKASVQPRPNYTSSFSVIGSREERGVRAPSFGESPPTPGP